jgi:hypothetical protein
LFKDGFGITTRTVPKLLYYALFFCASQSLNNLNHAFSIHIAVLFERGADALALFLRDAFAESHPGVFYACHSAIGYFQAVVVQPGQGRQDIFKRRAARLFRMIMKLSGLKAGASIRLPAESSEAENLLARCWSPPQPAHSSPSLKARGFLRRRINPKF